MDGAGVFHKIPRMDDSRLAEVLGREVLADLVRRELLSPEWSEAFGFADLEHQVPANTASKFRIASLSKNLTGTALAKLVQDGRLDLDAPVSRYIGTVPDSWKSMTVLHLATHQSGIPHYLTEQDALNTIHYRTTAEALKKVMAMTLLHPPGQKETYSSLAYTVLAAVIEAASALPYLEYMAKEIFTPLGMLSTLADMPHQIIPGRTGYYVY